jgi:hypothetical protein
MDIVSHVLIGKLIANVTGVTPRDTNYIMLFSFLPDLTQIPLYLYLGYLKHRPFWIPCNSDWDNMRGQAKMFSMVWEIPHSILFVGFILLPLILILHLPLYLLLIYLAHIIIDLATHEGEWAIKPLYPMQITIHGRSNAWSWPFKKILFSWVVLVALIILTK